MATLQQGTPTTEKAILEKAKEFFPPWTEILDNAFEKLRFKSEYVREHFSDAVLEVNAEAYEIFQRYELKAFPNLVVMWMDAHNERVEKMHKEAVNRSLSAKESLGDVLKGVVSSVLHEAFPMIRKFQTSVSQMRKKRAGETFQESIRRLLVMLDIACEKAKGEVEAELGHTDIVVPDIETATETPDKAIFMACQHTLAERWWAATPMATAGRRGYLLTIDSKLGLKKAKRMKKYNLVAYVPDSVKEKKDLKGLSWIRPLSSLPADLKSTSGRL